MNDLKAPLLGKQAPEQEHIIVSLSDLSPPNKKEDSPQQNRNAFSEQQIGSSQLKAVSEDEEQNEERSVQVKQKTEDGEDHIDEDHFDQVVKEKLIELQEFQHRESEEKKINKADDLEANPIVQSNKLQDFVETEEVVNISHNLAVPGKLSIAASKLSQANMHRLSQFRSTLISHRNSKLANQKQSMFLAAGLNFNYDDVLNDIVEIEDGKLVVQQGDQIRKITIGPQMMKYLGEEVEEHVSEISKPLYTRINHYLSWFLVFYATINGACIPPWIMSIPAEKYMRISWRFFMQTVMMIPFLMYEKRNLAPENKHQYKLSYIFKLEHLKKVFLVAFSNSIWFTLVLFAFEWNFISHALVLSGLQQFCFSIQRIVKKEESHSYEPAGQAMVIFGLLCVFMDSITYDIAEIPPSTRHYRNYFLLFRKPWQRLVIGNFTAILVSFLMFKMSKYQGESRKVYPLFLNMALVFFFTSLNMTMSSYFFAGSDLVQHDSFWGWMGLFTSTQFSGFLYMSIILGMGNFVTQTLISKIFEPIIPATVALFEPIFSTLILQLVGVQIIPRGLACLGYVFILPGLFVIVIGQHLLGVKHKQEEDLLLKQQLEEEIARLQKLQEENENQKDLNKANQLIEGAEQNNEQNKEFDNSIPFPSANKSDIKIDGSNLKIPNSRISDKFPPSRFSYQKLSEFAVQAKESMKSQNLLKKADSSQSKEAQEPEENQTNKKDA